MTQDAAAGSADTYSLTASQSAESPPLLVGVMRESYLDERRVALIPASVAVLKKSKLSVIVQVGAGDAAGFRDADYVAQGAEIVADRAAVLARADVVVQVRTAGANADAGQADVASFRKG